MIFSLALSASFAWFYSFVFIDPDVSFSAGAPDDYTLYKITCPDNSSQHLTTTTETVGTDGFDVTDLQFGKITNLSFLEHENYVYYAIRIPKTDGKTVSLGVSYGSIESGDAHFEIHVPVKDQNGDIQYDNDEVIITELFEDEETLDSIKAIETDNAETFICYSYALSASSPYDYETIDEIDTLFVDQEKSSVNSVDGNGDPITTKLEMDIESVDGDYYYLYIKLEPNISLYKHFIEYLWNNMPFFLAYEIRVTLSLEP